MIRNISSIFLCCVLTACSSGGTSPVFSAIKGAVFGSGEEESTTPSGSATITREAIENSGLALIRANIDGEDIVNVLTATSLNSGYVTYVSSFRQSVTQLGGLVTGTRGLGGDLLSVGQAANDPIANLTAPAQWPTSLTRAYRFPAFGPSGDVITVNCTLSRQQEMEVTIVEIKHEVVAFTESCSGDGVSFTNTYLADRKSGQIWQSRQWVGKDVGYLNIETLEPFTE